MSRPIHDVEGQDVLLQILDATIGLIFTGDMPRILQAIDIHRLKASNGDIDATQSSEAQWRTFTTRCISSGQLLLFPSRISKGKASSQPARHVLIGFYDI